jgi:hypothetical protein
MAIITTPSYRGAGTIASSISGGVTIPQPTTVGIDDILLIVISTANDIFDTWPPTDWDEVPTPPTGFGTAGAAGGVRLSLAWKRATATTGNDVVTGNPGATNNYTVGRMFAFQGIARRGNPWEASATSNQTTAGTSIAMDSVTTLGPARHIVYCIAGDADTASTAQVTAATGSGVTNFAERSDNWVASGAGGGIWVASGTKATAGLAGGAGGVIASQVFSKWTGALRAVEPHSRSIVF